MVNKKFLAALLSAAMVFTSFSMPVFAESVDEIVIDEDEVDVVTEETPVTVVEDNTDAADETITVDEAATEVVTADDGSEIVQYPDETVDEEVTEAQASDTTVEETAETVGESTVSSDLFAYSGTIISDTKYANVVIDKNGDASLTWKGVSGAKKYKIRKVNNGSKETVSENASYIGFKTTKWNKSSKKNVTTIEYTTKKKKCVDTSYDPADKSVYAIEMYDAGGSLLAVYLAAPASKIYQVENNPKGKAIDVVFADAGADSYVFETCRGSSSFKPGKNDKYPIKEITVSSDGITTGNVGAVRTAKYTIGGSDLTYTDIDLSKYGNIDVKSKNRIYVRVTPVVNCGITGFTDKIAIKTCKAKGCQITKYAAPSIDKIVSETDHTEGCYAGARVYFTVNTSDGEFFKDPKSSSLRYEVQSSSNGDKYETIATIKGGAVSANGANGVANCEFSLTDLRPEVNYSYRIRAYLSSDSSEISAWSAPVDHSFCFPDVASVSSDSLKSGSIELSWQSEKCATSYAIYRTITGYSTEAEAAEAVAQGNAAMKSLNADSVKKAKGTYLKEADFKLAKTVVNSERAKDEVTANISGLKSNKYYGFVVYPVNIDTYGYDHGSTATGYAVPATPSPFKYTLGKNLFKLTWKKVKGAEGYRLERLTLSGNAALTLFDDDEDALWETMSANIIAKEYDSKTAKVTVNSGSSASDIEVAQPNVQYAYRVMTVFTKDGKTAYTDATDSVLALIGPKAVKSISIAPIVKGSSQWMDNSKNGSKPLYAVSENTFSEIGERPVKITIRANSDKKFVGYYEVEKRTGDGDYKDFNTFEAISTSPKDTDKYKHFKFGASSFTFYDSGLERGVKYTYRVRAIYTDGTVGSWLYKDFSVGGGWVAYAIDRPSNGTTGGNGAKYAASNKFSIEDKSFQITNSSTSPFYVQAGDTARIYIEYLNKLPGKSGCDIMELPTKHSFSVSSGDEEALTVTEPAVREVKLANGDTKDVCYVDITGVEATDGDTVKITLSSELPKDDGSTSYLPDLTYYVSITE